MSISPASATTGIAGLLDSTEQKRAETALRESEVRYRQVVQAMPVAVYTTDDQGRITLFNQAAAALWGREPKLGEDLWCGSWRIYRADGTPLPLDECPMAVTMREGRPLQGVEIIMERPDGTRRHVLPYPQPLFDPSGTLSGAVNILVDISDRKRAEEALQESDRRKDEFLATLAHELRNPLAPLANAVDLLRIKQSDPAVQGEIHGIMERQVRHLSRLVDDLLDVSRVTRGKLELRKEQVDLSTIVQNAIETSRPMLDLRGQRIFVEGLDQPLQLCADPLRLTQVIANLLNNASKYTDEGGEIFVSVAGGNGEAVIAVRDTGMGIPPDKLQTVFEPFSQLDQSLIRTQGGLGIGLTLAKSFVEMHGGRIEARSAGLGQGSEFVVSLPLLPDAVAAPTAGIVPAADQLVRRRILIVDDTRAAAFLLGQLLEALGQEVEICHDAFSGLEAARRQRPDMIFSDIAMPRMDGYQFAGRLRAEESLRDVTLVALTGYGQHSDRQRAKDAGFHHHLVKPVSIDTLRDLLNGEPTQATVNSF